jgi:hypothetical protein
MIVSVAIVIADSILVTITNVAFIVTTNATSIGSECLFVNSAVSANQLHHSSCY